MSENSDQASDLGSEVSNIGSSALEIDTSESENKVQKFAEKVKGFLESIGSAFKTGWDENAGYISTSIENLKSAFEHLKEAGSGLLSSIWENGGSELIANLGSLSSAVTGMFIDIGGQIAESLAGVFEHLDPSKNEAMQYFIDSLNRMLEAAETFISGLGGHFASWREHGLQEFFNNIADIGVALFGLASDIGGTVIEAIDKLFDHLDPANNERTQGFLDALNGLAESVETFILSIGGYFQTFMDSGGEEFLNNLGDIAMLVGTLAAQLASGIIDSVKAFMDSWVGQALIEGVAKALELASAAVEALLGFLADHQDVLPAFLGAWAGFKAGTKIVEIAGKISSFAGAAKDLALAIGPKLLSAVKGFFGLLSGGFKLLMGANPIVLIVAGITALIAAFVLAYKKCEWFRDGVNKVIEWLKGAWDKAVNWIKELIVGLIEGIKEKFEAVKEFFSGLVEGIKTVFSNVGEAIKTSFEGIKGFFSNVVEGIKTVFDKVIDFIKNPFEKAYNLVKGIVEKIKGLFNFDFKMPNIKTPHFTITPSGWQVGDLLKGKIPKLGISWYSNGKHIAVIKSGKFGKTLLEWVEIDNTEVNE